jgi:transcriptional regulator with XRE-family HTH domain
MGIATEYVLEELRFCRTSRGLSQDEFGRKIGYSGSHVSSVETSQRPPTNEYMEKIDEAFQTGGTYERMLTKLAKLDNTPIWLREWIEIEREAAALRWYEPAYVPGLLQTERYAQASLRSGRLSVAESDQRVASRLERQAVLLRDPPLQVFVTLDEMVISRTCGDASVMAEQLEHLVTCAERPEIQLQIVPTEVGMYSGLAGAFIIAELPDGSRFGHVDNQLVAQIVERPDIVASLGVTWDAIRSEALPCRSSLDLLKEAAKRWA